MQMQELRSLYHLPPHNNIVKLYEVMLEGNDLWFAFEFMSDGSLKDTLRHRRENKMDPLPEFAIRSILEQVLLGIDHMHSNGIYHRDLKPDNILLDGKRASVADFSMARSIQDHTAVTSYVSTRWYRAPEIILLSKKYTAPVDMFAMGCIGAELYSQTALFPGNDELDQLRRIFELTGTPMFARWDDGIRLLREHFGVVKWDTLILRPPTLRIPNVSDTTTQHFLLSLLRLDPARRPSALTALHHDYFDRDDESDDINESPTVVTQSPVTI